MEYPKTKKIEQTDDYHGTKVDDPYRWLEDLESESLMPPAIDHHHVELNAVIDG